MSSIGITVLISIVTFGLTALSGHLTTTKNTAARYAFWIGACIGVALVGTQSVWTALKNRELEENSAVLIDKIDKVGTQNQSVLTLLTERLPLVGDASPGKHSLAFGADPAVDNPAVRRRRVILLALRNEYILSHDRISTALLAGLEWPPSAWINARLQQLGEQWQIGPGAKPQALEILEEGGSSGKPGSGGQSDAGQNPRTSQITQASERGIFDSMDYRMSAASLHKVGDDIILDVVAAGHRDQLMRLYISSCYLLDDNGIRWDQPPGVADSGHLLQDAAELIPGTKLRSEFHFKSKGAVDGKEFTFVCTEVAPQMNRRIVLEDILPSP
jgi:hypothetical protein